MARTLRIAALFVLLGSTLPWLIGHGFAQSGDVQKARDTSLPQVDGVWAQKFVTTSISDPPVIGEVTSRTISFQKVTLDQDGEDLSMTEETCGVRIVSDQNAVETTIPNRFVANMNPVERNARLYRRDGAVYLHAPKHLKFYGVRPSLGTDELPSNKNASMVYDQDKDGNPGVTIKLSGILSGSLYVVQRSWDVLRGKHLSNGQFAGRVDWHTDQKVIEKSGRIFGEMEASKPHPDKEQSYFRMVKVDDGTSCAEIAKKGDKLF